MAWDSTPAAMSSIWPSAGSTADDNWGGPVVCGSSDALLHDDAEEVECDGDSWHEPPAEQEEQDLRHCRALHPDVREYSWQELEQSGWDPVEQRYSITEDDEDLRQHLGKRARDPYEDMARNHQRSLSSHLGARPVKNSRKSMNDFSMNHATHKQMHNPFASMFVQHQQPHQPHHAFSSPPHGTPSSHGTPFMPSSMPVPAFHSPPPQVPGRQPAMDVDMMAS